MITEEDKKKLTHLPYRSSKPIQEILKELGYKVYSGKHIAKVISGDGKHENLEIEEAAYLLNNRIAEQKEKIAKIKNPEAVTSGD